MKITFTLLLLSISSPLVLAQQSLDTLYTNERQLTSLFFEQPIQKGITGSEDFVFTYNREKGENLGLLQAKKGAASNLLVLTENAGIYSFVVVYKASLTQFNHFITDENNLKPRSKKSSQEIDSMSKPNEAFQHLCKRLLESTTQFEQIRQQDGIRLKMTQSFYYNNEVYVVYDLRNNSAIDYEINQLQLLKVLGNNRKKASYQEFPIQPLYAFQQPKIVTQNSSVRFVVVYPKFTLGKNSSLKVSLSERQGTRNLEISL